MRPVVMVVKDVGVVVVVVAVLVVEILMLFLRIWDMLYNDFD